MNTAEEAGQHGESKQLQTELSSQHNSAHSIFSLTLRCRVHPSGCTGRAWTLGISISVSIDDTNMVISAKDAQVTGFGDTAGSKDRCTGAYRNGRRQSY